MLTRPEHSRPIPTTIKAKAIVPTPKAKAVAIPMQRLTMKYEVMKSCFFFEYSYKDTSTV